MENWDLYNADKELTGDVVESGYSFGVGEFHLIVNIWIINHRDEFLVQKRSMNKDEFKGLFAGHGGSVISGETSPQGAMREVKEEIGIDIELDDKNLMQSVSWENGIFDNFVIRKDVSLEDVSTNSEVDEVRYMTINEIEDSIMEGKFIDYFSFYGVNYFKDILRFIEEV